MLRSRAAMQLGSATIVLWAIAAVTSLHATCQLAMEGYGVGIKQGVKHISLNCSTADGSSVPIGINRTYLGQHDTGSRFIGIRVIDNMPCMLNLVGPASVLYERTPVRYEAALLYFCGSHQLQFSVMTVSGLWTEQSGCSSIVPKKTGPCMTSVLNFANGTSVWIRNGRFLGNGAGSIVAVVNATVRIYNSHFDTNAGVVGAGVAAWMDSQLTIKHSHFKNNTAFSGGAIYAVASAVTLGDNLFDSNYCVLAPAEKPDRGWTVPEGVEIGRGGAGVYAESGGVIQVHGSVFYNNSCALGTGGGLAIRGSAIISNSTFENNMASEGGGVAAISYMWRSRLRIHSRNKIDSTLLVSGCVVSNNTRIGDWMTDAGSQIGHGSGLCLTGRWQAEVVATQFLDYPAQGDSVFQINTYPTGNGRATSLPTSVAIRNSSFQGTFQGSFEEFGSNGLDYYVQGADAFLNIYGLAKVHVFDSNISKYSAAGISFTADHSFYDDGLLGVTPNSTLHIFDSQISDNNGGGIVAKHFSSGHLHVIVDGTSLIARNRGDLGAGLKLQGVDLVVSPLSKIVGNHAGRAGGGLWLHNCTSSGPSQLSQMVHDNVAPFSKDVFVPPNLFTVLSKPTNSHGVVTQLTDDGAVPLLFLLRGEGGFPVEGALFLAEVTSNITKLTFSNRTDANGGLSLALRLALGRYHLNVSLFPDGPIADILNSKDNSNDNTENVRRAYKFNFTLLNCKEGQVVSSAVSSGICQMCPAGSFSFRPNATECVPCPTGASCPGGSLILPNLGYWQSSRGSVEVHKCPNPSACQQSNNQYFGEAATACRSGMLQKYKGMGPCQYVQSMLSTHHTSDDNTGTSVLCSEGHHGNLCGGCNLKQGYTVAQPFRCQLCGDRRTIIGLQVLAAVILLLVIKLLCHFTLRESTTTISAASGQNCSGHPSQGLPAAQMASTQSHALPLQPMAILKPFVLYLQYMLIVASLNVEWPAPIAFPVRALSALFSSAAGESMSINCVLSSSSTFPLAIRRTLFYLGMPFVMLVVLLAWECAWYIAEVIRHHYGRHPHLPRAAVLHTDSFVDHLLSNTIVVLFFFLPSLARTTFSLFACVSVDHPSDDAAPTAVGSFWIYDLGQLCYQGYHQRWALGLGVPLLIVLCVLIPASTLYIVLSKRHRLSTDAAVQRHYGFLFKTYRSSCCYWETIVVLQTLGLVAVSVFGYNLGSYLQVLVMGFALAAVAAILGFIKPYAQPATQSVMTQGIFCTCLTSCVALTFWSDKFVSGFSPKGAYRYAMAVVLLILNVVYVVSVALKLHKLIKWKEVFAKLFALGSKVLGVMLAVFENAVHAMSARIWSPL